MLLIGMFDSPFVRRVAISLEALQLDFEHRNWSVGRDFDRIRAYSPLGRVPVLVLDGGEVLTESAAILEYLDRRVGPERALTPAAAADALPLLRLMAFATGAVATQAPIGTPPPSPFAKVMISGCTPNCS